MRRFGFCVLTVIAIASANTFAADEAGFEPIFDGKTFTGWKTWDPDYWSIKDGAIIGTITKERPLKENRYLIWKGNEKAPDGELANFELKLKSRVRGEGGRFRCTAFALKDKRGGKTWSITEVCRGPDGLH